MEAREEKKHQVKLDGRRRLEIDGVDGVISFDEDYVYISTNMGRIEIDGKGMLIEDLSKSTGRILISGTINQISYKDGEKKKGFFG